MVSDIAEKAAQLEVENMLLKIERESLFYDLRHRMIFNAMREMKLKEKTVTTLLLAEFLKSKKELDQVGGLSYLEEIKDDVPTSVLFEDYLAEMKEKHHRRFLKATADKLTRYADATEIDLKDTQDWLSELSDSTSKAVSKKAPLKIWRQKEVMKYEIPSHLQLVGDNEISMGYDGVCVLAGPGSSGKSLATVSLALAGTIGKGTWMGRKVHRKFKTLIIQAENGIVRIKKEFEAIAKNYPNLDIDNHVFISEPPEGGLPFHNADFRAAVRRKIVELEIDLVIVDPWSQVATEDAAKEVVDKLGEIRSCFPPGDRCPGLIIVAHTSKPRPEHVRKGRGLAYMVSGSVALPNTARTVYVLLPWSDDLTDDRIFWACPKLNNGENYAPTVWHRRFGTFFEHDPNTDATTWGLEEDRENHQEFRRAITMDMLKKAFGDRPGMKRKELVKALEAQGVDSQTIYRAIKAGSGYLAEHLYEVAGVISLNKPKKQ